MEILFVLWINEMISIGILLKKIKSKISVVINNSNTAQQARIYLSIRGKKDGNSSHILKILGKVK